MMNTFFNFIIVSFLLFFLPSCHSSYKESQFVSPQELTKEAMYQDYDTLVELIVEINPQMAIRKQVTGLDIAQRLMKLRDGIDTCSTGEFYDIIRQALSLCQDGHAGILPSFYFQEIDHLQTWKGDTVSKEALDITRKYRGYLDSIYNLKKLHLPIHYRDGKYLLSSDFSYYNQTFQKGAELASCNDQQIHSFVKSLIHHKFLRWDYTHKRFFHEDFLSAFNLIRNQKLTVTFRSPDGRLTSTRFDLYDSLNIKERESKVSKSKTVEYFDSLRFLYIRVPEMDITDTAFYKYEIDKYRHHPIEKVAIDIRNNPGGSDLVGEKIIEMLIDKLFYTQITLLANPSKKVAKYLKEDFSLAHLIELPFMKDKKYWKVYEFYKNVFPDKGSIRYGGPIYIIQNEHIYSAAGTLAAYAQYSEKILSVGVPTGRLLGKGVNPMIFELPNSHLLFRLEPVLDVSHAEKAESVYHDGIEIPVPLTADENWKGSTEKQIHSQRMYIVTQDPFVQSVLKHK